MYGWIWRGLNEWMNEWMNTLLNNFDKTQVNEIKTEYQMSK